MNTRPALLPAFRLMRRFSELIRLLLGKIFWTSVRRSRSRVLSRMLGRVYLRLRRSAMFAGTPVDQEVRTAICTVDGWFAGSSNVGEFSLWLNGEPVTFVPLKRTPVSSIFGEQHSRGFRARFDVSQFLTEPLRRERTLYLDVVAGGQVLATQRLRLSTEAMTQACTSAKHRVMKREWILRHVIHPGGFQDGHVLNFLPDEWKQEFRIDNPAAISAHQYDEIARDIIEDVRRAGGKVLDCGSGLRANIDETVICVEVAPLPTVDVLAVNQRLPFCDAVFDAVLSLNVLEHVTDPFACAAELVRVLKPGGVLYCCIPFLQPEHGYPHHYFNATRAGLAQLFEKQMRPVRMFVPPSGEPVWSLSWFISSYSAELPEGERHRFLNMRLRDMVDQPPQALLSKRWVANLSEAGKWELASTTAAVFRKPD